MNVTMLRAKIHRATVTHAELHYEGSIAIDEDLLIASGILPYEQIHAWNVSNGLRFVTYALKGDAGSGVISVNGSAARSVQVGDILIIAAFGSFEHAEARTLQPRVVHVDAQNRVRG
ncbi:MULTISPECIES: aspartate 1-decarboxylase [Xanthomonas]|uniref:Aspartate 1-decarboxylase n=1 Tax=Xanthomonas hortorum pv. hederae TaxID=453603 RepID=A0A9X4BRL7_9XANT|nr:MULTISPECIES: aspartate 1-decarboxylase [Xanthomonas]MDC8638255.1 aspartate 1-decarboxylase [Xanthomonas hortorum pv. hederae]PPU13555.1 aspartate 1-decarboxylase [Xanthomonas arboricola]QDS16147.1 aspartate 1-decarboxylase [Xanthomonas arboricola]SOU07160.1 aspartate alpha-decarboxylase [Xanthomonas arboricola pv. fragariae]